MNKGHVIACTQPRRVAAVTIATRVAQEVKSDLGKLVSMTKRQPLITICINVRVEFGEEEWVTDSHLLKLSPKSTGYQCGKSKFRCGKFHSTMRNVKWI